MQLEQRHVSQARVEIITGIGHFAMLEALDAVSQARVRFLASLS